MLSDRPERVMALWIPELDERWIEARRDPAARRRRGRAETAEDREAAEGRLRRWQDLLGAVEQLIPGIESIRPGLCAMRARGPARYYGGEAEAAAALLECVRAGDAARVGIASGIFAAEQAARAAEGDPGVESPVPGVRITAAEATARLLGPLPVGRATDEALAETLVSLGIRTLGAFAALPDSAVHERFGAAGARAHRLANGLATTPAPEVRPREPVKDLAVGLAFEPPLAGDDQLAFACSASAEELVGGLTGRGLVCTELRVELTDDAGARHERVWAHPARFTAADVVNRVRWQAGALPRGVERGGSGIVEVRLTPLRTARAADHEPGLWSTAPDERVHHHLSRVQSLLGHEGVGTGELVGGRLSADRQRLAPWGTGPLARRGTAGRAAGSSPIRSRTGPWPGSLPGGSPSAVFAEPRPAALLDRAGCAIGVDAEQFLSADPARLGVGGRMLAAPVRGWSSLWPLRERWWADAPTSTNTDTGAGIGAEAGTGMTVAGPSYRMQLLLEGGDAWLLRHEPVIGWLAEARYA